MINRRLIAEPHNWAVIAFALIVGSALLTLFHGVFCRTSPQSEN